ncbi:hypothetical protein PGT21_030533 [Puccinia graminis f. sp. tritici]|uniref:RING-type domain-containing protein n=1 Tax=Puccinia graminis f. sp. tritici TaxID=56615 RepID=A0A5B0MQY0_PUCGR|nr:hypothetical protein PGT21_030533 [Puccinia graminis f. sp. tritici]KAA1078538.1 hypothetical protein PGTUg99_009383 [Puccinia graminis f. sp. tritici]
MISFLICILLTLPVDSSAMENSKKNYQIISGEGIFPHEIVENPPSLVCSNEIDTVSRSPFSTTASENMNSQSFKQEKLKAVGSPQTSRMQNYFFPSKIQNDYKSNTHSLEVVDPFKEKNEEVTKRCLICYEKSGDPHRMKCCQNSIHKDCLDIWLRNKYFKRCIYCQQSKDSILFPSIFSTRNIHPVTLFFKNFILRDTFIIIIVWTWVLHHILNKNH